MVTSSAPSDAPRGHAQRRCNGHLRLADLASLPGTRIVGVTNDVGAAGVPVGAVITRVDDHVIDSVDTRCAQVSHLPIDTVSVSYTAPAGDTRTAHVTLGSDGEQQSS